jgi:ABC-type sugar transport system permease subunit
MTLSATRRSIDRWSALKQIIPPMLFLTPAALVLLLFMAVPMLNAIILSFQQWNGMVTPRFNGGANYLA